MTARFIIPSALIVAAAFVAAATVRDARTTAAVAAVKLPIAIAGTSRAELTSTVGIMSARLKANPSDAAAVVSLANSLIRLQRVNSDGRAVPVRSIAEQHILEDFGGFIPTLQDYLCAMEYKPWMNGQGDPPSRTGLPTARLAKVGD